MGIIKEGIKTYAIIAIVLLMIFGLYIMLSFAGLIVAPSFLKLQRQVYTGSYQYTEAKETELLNLVTEYADLETKKQEYIVANETQYSTLINNIENQQKVLGDRIRNEAERIDPDLLPKSVKTFLREHPR